MQSLKAPRYSTTRRLLPVSARRLKIIRYIINIILVAALIETHLVHHRLYKADQHRQIQRLPQETPRVYIASLHWNNEIILREFWNQKLLELVQALGPQNVFVSVYESGSWDQSKEALHELDEALGTLGAGRSFTLDETTHEEEIASPPTVPGNGWVRTAEGEMGLRRIPYLARLRNKSLQPLVDMAQSGTTFDYVLFLGDVFFTVCLLRTVFTR